MGYRSLKVIQTGIIRKTGCSFLFAFHSNYGSILHHFPDIFWKSWFLHTPMHMSPPSRGLRWSIAILFRVEKLDRFGYRWWKNFDMYNRFYRILACDRWTKEQTDRRTSCNDTVHSAYRVLIKWSKLTNFNREVFKPRNWYNNLSKCWF